MASQQMVRPYPQFSELPLDPSHPPHSAWGLWGREDELGTLNHLTPVRVAAAAKEVKAGARFGLNWALEQMDYTGGFRETIKHEIFQPTENMNDDRITFNTQTRTQWDALRHWGFDDGRFYNGFTQKEIVENKSSGMGIQAWAKRGLVGRGVLIDFVSYAARNNIQYDPLDFYAVSLPIVKQIAKECSYDFQAGDIILLRTGFTTAFENTSLEMKKAVMARTPFKYPGMESTLEVLGWLWDTQIAAVAGDCPGFEAWPPTEHALQQVLLAGFGLPIGEMFALDELAAECEKQQRWTFMFTSEPLNVKGGVASPPNALAIM
ncbi:putative cyclase [Bimuria novae-zelandiae CBS 107.79]|uniref:Putative cyclase n=1 Tax=Bimuria novae-zelandiae CBS 107.79 TaxID=1447943 RepID=A0A6A5V7L6_9PLEO|nr:putative cyclase [Bimuria novae-zelandiae CBS 107.79]